MFGLQRICQASLLLLIILAMSTDHNKTGVWLSMCRGQSAKL